MKGGKYCHLNLTSLNFIVNFFLETCVFNKYRPLYSCEGMLGNQDKMVEKLKVCMRIQSHLIPAN